MIPRTLVCYFFCVLWQSHSVPMEEDDFADSLENISHDSKQLDEHATQFGTTPKQVGSSSCTGLDDKTGHCGYLKRCFSDDYRSNFALAMSHSCTIDRTYVGTCCFSHRREAPGNSTIDESFVNVLPIIAVDVGERIDGQVSGDSSRIVWMVEESGPTTASVEVNRNSERSRGCGTSLKTHGRLVGGRPADPTEWPWMAALLRKGETRYCGGVLITDRHVLTAAHCVYKTNPRDIKVRLGEYDFSSPDETRALDFAVLEIRVHRDFDYISYENDIATVKMRQPTVFNSYIWPVCLPPVDQTFENRNAVVTGWGTQYFGGPVSTVLMEVSVPIWPQEKCVESFVQRIPRTAMCAGAYEGGRDACQGDSGGPLLHQLGNGRWVNVGIVSWGIRCGDADRPGIYTRVSSYLDWIFENAVF
ncbi:chymotrypsin-C [Andrena cerasifolii]|uniref:chymotrypsin-C n=1 Tax=Andrena cerasifolii TaxID=2819439 RepID=UPI004038369F